jgi:hypothetical protein
LHVSKPKSKYNAPKKASNASSNNLFEFLPLFSSICFDIIKYWSIPNLFAYLANISLSSIFVIDKEEDEEEEDLYIDEEEENILRKIEELLSQENNTSLDLGSHELARVLDILANSCEASPMFS